MNKLKRMISLFVSVNILLLSLLSINVSAVEVINGSCGDNVEWSLSGDTLTITGNGKMKDYKGGYQWENNCKSIKTIVIKDGVTSIGSYAFSICDNVKNIYIPKSVIYINDNAFLDCYSLRKVFYSGSKADWDNIIISQIGNDNLTRLDIYFEEQEHVCVFGEWNVSLEPTCTTTGNRFRKCTHQGCENIQKEIIPATGIHDYIWTVAVKPTCTNEGKEVLICRVCYKEKDARNINKIDHQAGEYIVTKKPSCTEKGEQCLYCAICNTELETKELNKLEHSAGNWEIVVKAECEKDGLRVKKCKLCGKIVTEEKIDKLNHNFGGWTVTIKPTIDYEGEETRICKKCDKQEKRPISKLTSEMNIIGDANGDGEVTAKDARLVLQVVANLSAVKDFVFNNADVNDDKSVTAKDARIILQMVAGLK